MSQSRPPFQYDLSKITEFDHALIYGFDPESSVQTMTQETHPIDYLLHSSGQFEDMFQAYYYAQEVILPAIRKKGIKNITADDLLLWWDELHKRIAYTLALDHGQPELAGHYTFGQITRWHQGTDVSNLLQSQFLIERGSEVIVQYLNTFSNSFESAMENYKVDLELAKKYVALLHRYHDLDIPLTKSEQACLEIDKEHAAYPAVTATIKLMSAYHSGLLQSEEKKVVDALCKVCSRPEEMPALMRAAAEKIARAWNQCDGRNRQVLAKFCSYAFKKMTKKHGYFNCNGRLSTCFDQIIARSFEHQSFLMRNPGEKTDPTSSYAKAIDHINDQPALLESHIFSRIRMADKGKNYSDKARKQAIAGQIELSQVCLTIYNEFPHIPLQERWPQWEDQWNVSAIQFCKESNLNFMKLPEINKSIAVQQMGVMHLTQYLNQLRQAQQLHASMTPVVKRQYSDQEKRDIVLQLETLTGLKGWKVYTKNGLQLLLNMETLESAKQLAAALSQTKAMTAIEKLVSATKTPAVFLESINPARLAEVNALNGWMKPNQTKTSCDSSPTPLQ